ncbi:O-antigen polysaccharide polymerase Wzy [Prochlorococcus marinus XMU1410]|uniref:O-antigen polysaccharide polymerase Wzy n=1 Tax=Prochlorococcus marinus TaxID=1219 RepID=UPI001AD9B66B|nr:O-antigen polysaccharide polymerase Wzy [Prochlorococcus marinus]MBO8242371.1 O-antigen polysaccharide polymerase Wzy [Prochlorococcus marinus XMU1410]MBW3053519.1 hypothetical protein [Prochlorococcus marinus str. MU1410]
MNNIYFSNTEIILLVSLTVLILLPLRLINPQFKLSFVNPLLIYSLIISYYCLISPIYRIFTNQTTTRTVDFREFLIYGWFGTLLSLTFLYIGYFFCKQRDYQKRRISYIKTDQIWKIGFLINVFGILMFLIYSGFDLGFFNPFDNSKAVLLEFLNYDGPLESYLLGGQDLLIPGNLLMLTSFIKDRKRKLLTLSTLLITLGLFLNQGFRFRLFIFTFSIFFFIFISNKFKKSFNKLFIFIGFIGFILFNSFFELIRTYNGFNFSNLSNFRSSELISALLAPAETDVFFTTSGLISSTPEKIPFVYQYPLIKAILHPLPSAWVEKGSDHINDALIMFFGGNHNLAKGAVVLNIGEYYLMFGWLGIIIGSFILGFILKKLWIWVLIHYDEPLSIPLYLIHFSFIFIIISRGYIPQQLNIYAFSILPVTLTYIFYSRKFKKKIIRKIT